ncbi:fumarylacetoacetate hydrolase [Polaromonas sp. OV174]|uniref:fumarylacetoacetase n=1 Tax=Polaromonas sp. OV174 TaxID=1855300 RepID=UPI0008E94E0D|nr:fumarylacetoacetase [Polaromonas sp. OV174]SFC15110.1 fumarylacetoacetate hydrolase [Polaromonas sp. OV174]
MSNTLNPIDATHELQLYSWVESAAGHAQFPIQNLPLGVFRTSSGSGARIGVAIGDQVLDLPAALQAGLLTQLDAATAQAMAAPVLNAWMALSAAQRRALRWQLSALLNADTPEGRRASEQQTEILKLQADCEMLLPADVGDFSDYYAGIHHATNAGKFFRPDSPLLPNYKHVPVAYHGRASSLRPSGTVLHRPTGQLRQDTPDGPVPVFQPSERIDYELELALWVGPGNALTQAIPIAEADQHVAGFGLLNDWSARDIQAWEYQPLGPFQGKNFLSSLSPWVITSDALAPFRAPAMARGAGDPQPLPYLHDEQDQRQGGLRIELEVFLSTRSMREQGAPPHRLSRGDSTHLWWTPAQMVTHHTAGGCNLRPGDLIGSGTISTPESSGFGCLLEITEGGKKAVQLPNGETRTFLQDGDELVMRGHCQREGFAAIGLGECRGLVQG